ncbi:hypothetical protein HQN89_35580 [Paenibacillus frigoriresistens]|uniref:DUF5659 domain-containing protein n=1 Tax=Paenibacillus alginolyticus TaxID=59839 RepID=UPI00156560CE|nr:DUF5659 domain-containing protein [Paenibacillus frigoriresistens]NRF96120.1 hypothetical protein [Paenibacillus frigoriresistens]
MSQDYITNVMKIQKLAGFLMKKGFKLNGKEQARTDQDQNVFFFTNSDELKQAIQEYKAI